MKIVLASQHKKHPNKSLSRFDTDSDLKVCALHYANELLVLAFQKLLQTRQTSRNNKKLCKKGFWSSLMIFLGNSEINSIPEWRGFLLTNANVYTYNNLREQILFIQIAKLKKFSTLKNSPCPLPQSIKVHRRALVLLPCLIPCHHCEKLSRNLATLTIFDHTTWQHTRENPQHVREAARIYDVRMAQFVLKIEKLSHITGPRGSQDLRSPSPIMAPALL